MVVGFFTNTATPEELQRSFPPILPCHLPPGRSPPSHHHSGRGEAAPLGPCWGWKRACGLTPPGTPAPPPHLLGLFLFQIPL